MDEDLKTFLLIGITIGICFVLIEEVVAPVVFGSYRLSKSTPTYDNIHAMDYEKEAQAPVYVSRTDLPTLKEDGTSAIPKR
jgi:hypothetical protein